MSEERLGILKFPCQFPIKVMGKAENELDLVIINIIAQHVDQLPAEAIKKRFSNKGRYLSITATIEATSQQQLDAIYQQLSDNPRILMTL
jgi:putative lipoic acid-binding regulatory protein